MVAARSFLLPSMAALAGMALLAAYAVVARDPGPTGSILARPAPLGEAASENAPKLLLSTVNDAGPELQPQGQVGPSAAARPEPSPAEQVHDTHPNIQLAQAQPSQAAPATRQAPAPQPPVAPAAQPPAAPAAPAPARQPAQIDRNNLLFLVRSTLMALHQANETGNYSVLRELSAPGFQSVNNQARLAEIFANLRAQKLDLSAVSILEPQLTSVPSIDANNMLLIEGTYPQIPPQVAFQLLFQPVDGRWRLQGISINLGPAAPAQQPAPAASQPAPAPAAAAQPQQPPAAAPAAGRPAPTAAPRPTPPRPAPQPRRTPAPEPEE